MKRSVFGLALLGWSLGAAAQNCIPSGVTDQYTYFVAVDSGDKVTRETGLNSFTVVRSRNGAADVTFTTPTVLEIDGSTMPGVYALLLDEDMTLDAGDDVQHMALHITHSGMEPVTKEICIARSKVTAGETLTVSSGVGSANVAQISGDSTAADNLEAFLDLIVGQSGSFAPLGIKASGTAQAYTPGTPSVTLASAEAFGDDTLVGNLIWVRGSSDATYWQEALIVSNVGSTDVATIDEAFAVSPSGTLTYIIWGTADIKASSGGATAEEIADEVETRFPANFADLSITAGTGRVDVALIEGSDATNQIRDSVVDDATRIDASALNTASTRVATALPNAASGQNGGLPTVDGNNRIAGIQGTINTLDALNTAQEAQHAATQGLIATVDGVVDDIKAVTDVLPDAGALTSLAAAADVAAILAVADKLDTALEADGEVYRLTENALEQAPTGEGSSVSAIAEAVWEYLLADCEEEMGSVCEALAAASAGGGGGGLDAAGIREAIGLSEANLDAQLAALPTATEIRQEMDSNSTDLNALMAARTQLFQGTADGGDTNTLVDAALTTRFPSNDLLNGRYVVRSDGQACFVADYVASSGTVEFGDCAFTGDWSTQTYDIYPAGTQ